MTTTPPGPHQRKHSRIVANSSEIGGEYIELAWHGPNHSPDNIFIFICLVILL